MKALEFLMGRVVSLNAVLSANENYYYLLLIMIRICFKVRRN